jgi:hypothetical protein
MKEAHMITERRPFVAGDVDGDPHEERAGS